MKGWCLDFIGRENISSAMPAQSQPPHGSRVKTDNEDIIAVHAARATLEKRQDETPSKRRVVEPA